MYRRDGEKLHCRDGEQAENFSASQGVEQAGFSAQDGSEDVEDSCRRAGDVPGFWSRAEDVGYFWSRALAPGRACCSRGDEGAYGSRHGYTSCTSVYSSLCKLRGARSNQQWTLLSQQ
jgi:hypothetical protein